MQLLFLVLLKIHFMNKHKQNNNKMNLTLCSLPSGSPLARSTVVTAIKFTIVDQPAPIDSLLKDCIGETHRKLLLVFKG